MSAVAVEDELELLVEAIRGSSRGSIGDRRDVDGVDLAVREPGDHLLAPDEQRRLCVRSAWPVHRSECHVGSAESSGDILVPGQEGGVGSGHGGEPTALLAPILEPGATPYDIESNDLASSQG